MSETKFYPVNGAHRGMTTSDGRRFQMWEYERGVWVVQEYGDAGKVLRSEDGQKDATACDRIVQRWRTHG